MSEPAVGVVFWHRDLPPLDDEPVGEHEIVARSRATPFRYADRDALWHEVYPSLMEEATRRITAEVARLGGSSAHVIDEDISSSVDNQTNEYRLTGTFRFVLYQRGTVAPNPRGGGNSPTEVVPRGPT